MISVLLSKVNGIDKSVCKEIKKIINKDYKVAIFPWAFPVELNADKLENEYFKVGESRYQRYIDFLDNIGINKNNIVICNCYSDSKTNLKRIIKESDILLFPGGNPEMLYSKIVQEKELLYDIKHFKGIVIGESAGAVLQFKRYFITAKNNYYGYEAFYDGFGILNDPFYIDVHTDSNINYLNRLKEISLEKKKDVYAIYDDGCIVVNRKTNEIKTFGHVDIFKDSNK